MLPSYLCASISIVCGEWETCVGDVAYGDGLNFSAVDNLDRAINASGKLGGVAGVLAGAHNWKTKRQIVINSKRSST